MRTITICLIAGLLGFLANAAPCAEEEKVPLDKLPKPVLDAVKAKFPDAKLVGAEKEVEKGKTLYEVSFKYKDQNYDVGVLADGKIVEVEKEITAKDLPKEVNEALDAKFPKAAIKKVEEISKDDKTTYEVLLVTAEKKVTWEVVFDPKGKILEEERKKKGED